MYATEAEAGGKSEEHSLKLWSAHFNLDEGYGSMWVEYSHEVYDEKGETIQGCGECLVLWRFEKNSTGEWKLIDIVEAPKQI